MPDKEIMNQDECTEKSVDAGVWLRMLRNYAVLMVVGLLMLTYLMPQLHTNASVPMMAGVMIGGLSLFGGGFGVVVSLVFHYINKNK